MTVPTATSFETLRLCLWMAKDDEVAFWFQLFAVSSHGWSGTVIYTKGPTR